MSRRARTPTPINATTELAQALRQISRVLQGQQEQQVDQATKTRVGMSDFLRHNPAKFNGKATPDEADDWICNNEKIFDAIDCSEAQKLVFATFMLAGEAEYWWRGLRMGMDARGEVASWEDFKNKFLERYFPMNAKMEREAEFLTLQQGNMSVQAYKERFEYLARFYTQNMSEEWKCRKFERGLRHNLLEALVLLKINRFPELVEQAKVLEQMKEKGRVMRNERGSFSGGKTQKNPYERPPSFNKGILKCFECGGDHLRRNCPKLLDKKEVRICFTCNKPGHISRDCPQRKTSGGVPQKTVNVGKPQASGRVFAMSGTEAEKSDGIADDTRME